MATFLVAGMTSASCSWGGDQLDGLGPAEPSALEAAAGRGDFVRVDALLSDGADPDHGIWSTPIFAVVDDREASPDADEIIRLLARHGADVELGGLNGTDQTPLQRAALRGHQELVQTLLELGADPCARVAQGEDFHGMTALDIAQELESAQVKATLAGASAECE